MKIDEILYAKNKLERGFKVFVESLIDKEYNSKWGFYFHKGAIGKVVNIGQYGEMLNNDFYMKVEWLKDKIIEYGMDDDIYDRYTFKSIKLKEIVPPKDPNQLEFLFK